ncbi:hypothetical protein BR93DRAFT_127042 [Coniochaeta sp. PMI_546]|nr:hypothetical protein BR93DRAFT_127042 [Coniochaeta sp. PMI_546]
MSYLSSKTRVYSVLGLNSSRLDNDLPRRTACDNLLELLSRSALDYLEHISVLWEPMVAFVTPKSASRSLLSNRVELLLRSFQLAESAEELGILNDEEMAVLHRRPSVLKRHSVHWSKHDGHTVMNGPGFEPTQLALGWDTGLRYLVAAHCPVERAIVTTCILGDQESLRILLQTPRPVFSASSIMPDNDQESWIEKAVDRLYWRSPASYTGFDLILTELIRRRNILKHLALTELSSLQQREFGLDEPSIPDSQSEAIFHCLKQIIHVPDELDCWISPHHMIRKCDDMPAKLLDKIYNAGFRSVDIPYKGETPLFWRLARDAAYQFSCTHLDYLPWFLSHGARAEWSDVSQLDNTRYPTALFYIGPILRFNYQYHSQLLKACEDSSLWVPTNLHLITDDCTCLCGTRGCLASHLLWRCTARNCFCFSETMRWRLEVLKRWISVWRLSGHEKEIVYSEVTRLELFERLGMAHTCCCTKLPDCWTDWKPIRRLCPDEEERARLRDEDSELALQLDDLLAQYDIARKAHGGSIESFWRHWWQVLNEILPPLLPVAACKNRLLGPWHRSSEDSQEEYRKRNQETIENRAAQEQEALKCAGYIGPEYEDFRQVIRVHLSGRDWDPSVFDDADSEEWEMCSSGTDTNASEATDEDERAHGNAR